ncbi:hypothetical protein SUNI508_13404 [Seiridium unicorne]|uniref:TLDc domain-containing protein n=1 Tax=Seiridium unicorne TaxID=138068 RepID=A0ABR2VD78_9PEZI
MTLRTSYLRRPLLLPDSLADDEKIDNWKSEGKLEVPNILDRIRAESAIRPASSKIPPGANDLDEAAFIALLHTQGNLPKSCSFFGHLIYKIVAYLSVAPFYPQPGEKSPPNLSLTEIYRGSAWALPEVYHNLVPENNFSRLRTAADHHRLLFQSLATTTYDGPYDPVKARQRATRNAYFVTNPANDRLEWPSVNSDNDGDEMFHDVLDILHATQPRINSVVEVKPDKFRNCAKDLTRGKPDFNSLAIPLNLFKEFVAFSLALQFESRSPEQPVRAQYEGAAKDVVASFCEDGKSNIITWPRFDDMLRQMPSLFDPLHRLLCSTFLENMPFDVCGSWLAPNPPQDSFMTLPRLSQLATMLDQDVNFEHFDRAHQWHTGIRPTARVLVAAIKTMPGLSLLIMCGVSNTGEKFVFGIFNPDICDIEENNTEDVDDGEDEDEEDRRVVVRELDDVHDCVELRSDIDYVARPLIFVLSPAQHMVRLKDEHRIVGDRLHFDDALSIANNGTAELKVGVGTVIIKIKAIEIWGHF